MQKNLAPIFEMKKRNYRATFSLVVRSQKNVQYDWTEDKCLEHRLTVTINNENV